MYNLEESYNIDKYKVICSNKNNFKEKYILIKKKLYKVAYDQINNKLLKIYGLNNKITRINIINYDIKNTISIINIKIIKSINLEIFEEELIKKIKEYLLDLFVYDKMIINLDDIELEIKLPYNSYHKYYLIDKNIKIIIDSVNYKLYNKIININNTNLLYISYDINHINGNFKRGLLDNMYIINNKDILNELNNIKDKLYLGKSFIVHSNNCEFNLTINYLKLNNNQNINNSIFCFDSSYDINLIPYKYVFNNNIKLFDSKSCEHIIFKIENGDCNNKIYDINKIKHEINNVILYNYIKIGDIIKIIICNQLITLKIININYIDTNHYVYYINNILNIKFHICDNTDKKIYAYNLDKIKNITSLTVNILNYNNLFNNEKIINMDTIKNHVYSLKYFYYKELKYFTNNFTFLFDNIIIENNEKIYNDYLLIINHSTQINIIKDESCNNIKILDNNKSNNSIILSNDDIKNIVFKFKELGLTGMDDQINKIVKEILLPRTNYYPESFKKFIKIPKGFILYGPPGTGKTTLARNFAKILNISNDNINMINGTEVFSKWLGESEKNIRELFNNPRMDKNNLYLLIIDEVDSIFKTRDNNSSESTKSDVVNQFLGEIDGLKEINNLLIIGITNRIDMIDKAILRPGRFSSKIYCGLPNENDRMQIIKLYHNKIMNDIEFDNINFDILVKETDQLSGAEIEYIYTKIIELVIENNFNDKKIIITNEIILDIIKNIK